MVEQLGRTLKLVSVATQKALATRIEVNRGADAQVYDMLTLCMACLHSTRDAALAHSGTKYGDWLRESPAPPFLSELHGLMWMRNLQHHGLERMHDVIQQETLQRSYIVWTARVNLPKNTISNKVTPAIFEHGAQAYDEHVAHDIVLRPLWRAAALLQDRLDLAPFNIIDVEQVEEFGRQQKALDPRPSARAMLAEHRGRKAFFKGRPPAIRTPWPNPNDDGPRTEDSATTTPPAR